MVTTHLALAGTRADYFHCSLVQMAEGVALQQHQGWCGVQEAAGFAVMPA